MALVLRQRPTVLIEQFPGVDGKPGDERIRERLADGQPTVGAADSLRADTRYLLGSYGLVVIGAGIGCALFAAIDPSPAITAAAGFAVVAPLYIAAQAIERLVEPLTNFDSFGKAAPSAEGAADPRTKRKAKAARDEAFAAFANAAPDQAAPAAKTAAETQAQVDRIRKNRALLGWGIASALGTVVCGAIGLRLLLLTGVAVNRYVDVIVTGLAIGSGTKPLHDLISNIEKTKDAKADSPAKT